MFPQVDAALSGYQGGTGSAEVIIDAVRRVKAANPAARRWPRASRLRLPGNHSRRPAWEPALRSVSRVAG